MVEVQLILINEFGEFHGKKILLTNKQLKEVINIAKTFYNSGGFELNLIDGSYMVFSPQIVQKSILKINQTEVEGDYISEDDEEDTEQENLEQVPPILDNEQDKEQDGQDV